ncbi:uncharacterized protein Nmag_2273 [Natrialba magadii ATCC 43099]|uniref:Uncharacterized protein n=1 Tax=Natrialba magadii (strain ATCC 43099 / DSM 3394 / CCM 3739 / CIP 104546 / IAM 13178 / JCM 8861 / NBRC 102185 / NCIMB 2190 / MS3) TaxID=547559 RepID=D3SWV6_NATMM|nr:hypothetical protein [Natrialba magadii]ADD05838.1 uncharacterized protein Nmag_2273 [Natrialba magadii ATCC 43099]ELY30168.1 hypothetical protein C500_09049 [Natrialba magadii ATCC 43099]
MTRTGSGPTKTDGTTAARSTSLAVASVGVLAALLVLAAIGTPIAGTALVGPAAAGDQYATLTPTPYTVDAEPGEEFTAEVLLYTEGGHDGEGVSEVSLIAQYHPDILEITEIERGPWLEQGEEATAAIETEQVLAHDDGTAIFEQWREPAGDGATGHGELVTVTGEIAADAPDVETAISFDETRIELIRDWPLPIDAQGIEVTIGDGDDGDGAGDEQDAIEPFDHPDPADIDRESLDTGTSDDNGAGGSTDADDADDGSNTATGSDEQPATDDDGTDSVPGFTAFLTGTLLAGGSLVLARHTHRSNRGRGQQ